MDQGYIQHDINDNIGIIEFFHPNHNSLHSTLLKNLSEKIKELDENENVSIIILKSAGERTFCAGANFDELLAVKNKKEAVAFFMGFANVILAMKNCSKLILGQVQGKAIGGGLGITAACDYVIATVNSEIKLSELSIGIGPFVIGPAVERKIGLSDFSKMALNPRLFFSAEWALMSGLYFQVAKDLQELNLLAKLKAEELANYSDDAKAEIKKMLWVNTENFEILMSQRAEISASLLMNENTKQNLAAFKSK